VQIGVEGAGSKLVRMCGAAKFPPRKSGGRMDAGGASYGPRPGLRGSRHSMQGRRSKNTGLELRGRKPQPLVVGHTAKGASLGVFGGALVDHLGRRRRRRNGQARDGGAASCCVEGRRLPQPDCRQRGSALLAEAKSSTKSLRGFGTKAPGRIVNARGFRPVRDGFILRCAPSWPSAWHAPAILDLGFVFAAFRCQYSK